MATIPEEAFETAICESPASVGGYDAVAVGNAADRQPDFSTELGLDTADLFRLIGDTQAEEFDKVYRSHFDPNGAQRALPNGWPKSSTNAARATC